MTFNTISVEPPHPPQARKINSWWPFLLGIVIVTPLYFGLTTILEKYVEAQVVRGTAYLLMFGFFRPMMELRCEEEELLVRSLAFQWVIGAFIGLFLAIINLSKGQDRFVFPPVSLAEAAILGAAGLSFGVKIGTIFLRLSLKILGSNNGTEETV